MSKEKKILRLFFVGDFYSKNVERINFSSDLERIIDTSNIVFCNFEAPIKTDNIAAQKVGPSLFQSVNAPEFLEKKGFNVIGLANNHIADFGQKGILKTMESFQHSLLLGVGTFDQAYSLKKVEIEGTTIGFLAFSHYEFGILDNRVDNKTLGSAWINHPCIDDLIRESVKKVDILILIAHAGVEDIDLPLPEWRERYKTFIHLGVDAVIGMHPHVPQGWELIDGKPIFYSLGNFLFDSRLGVRKDKWNEGFCVQFNLTHSEILFSIYPYNQNDDDVGLRKMNEKETEDFNCRLNVLNEIIKNRELLVQEYEKFVDSRQRSFLFFLQPYSNKYLRALFNRHLIPDIVTSTKKRMILNVVRCEAHRDVLLNLLDSK